MPDVKHARLALQMLPRANGLSDDEKAAIRKRANKIIGHAAESNSQTGLGQLNRNVMSWKFEPPTKKIKIKRMSEADRAANGKFANDQHTANAREHILAGSIAANGNDTEEAGRRITSAQIHASHSQNAKAPQALEALKQAEAALAIGNIEAVQKNLDIAYGALQGMPSVLLKMKKVRESAAKDGRLIETLTFHPRLIEGSFDPNARTVEVDIISEGLGNKRDRHYYRPDTLVEAVKSKVFDGAQAYADHPSKFDDANRPERSVRDLIGWYFDSKIIESNGKTTLRAKLKIQEGCDWALDLVKEAIAFNKKFPDKVYVGISINADGDTMPNERNGMNVHDVTKITEAFSADMVTKPARGGKFLQLVESVRGSSKENQVSKILDAATRIKKLAEGEEVDPAELRALATQLEEADKEKSKEAAGDIDDFSKKGKSVLESLTEKQKDKWGKSFATGDGTKKWESMSEADQKKWADDNKDDDDNDSEMTERKKEAAAFLATGGTLTEAQMKQLFPSIYASALKEAASLVGGSDNAEIIRLREANRALETEKKMRESYALASRLLSESALPPASFKHAMSQLVGLAESEMIDKIKFFESFNGSQDGQRAGAGGGGNLQLRESSRSSNTAILLDGVVED